MCHVGESGIIEFMIILKYKKIVIGIMCHVPASRILNQHFHKTAVTRGILADV